MGEPAVLGGSAVGAADVMQAGYFRGLLVAERDSLVHDLVKYRAKLAEQADSGGAIVLSRLHGEVLAKEHQLDHLDALISALDQRFASHWSAD